MHGSEDLRDKFTGAHERHAVRVLVLVVDGEIEQVRRIEKAPVMIIVRPLVDSKPRPGAFEFNELRIGHPQTDNIGALPVGDKLTESEALFKGLVGKVLMECLQPLLHVVDGHVIDPFLYLIDKGLVIPGNDNMSIEDNKPFNGGVDDRDRLTQEFIKSRLYLAGDVVGKVCRIWSLAVRGAKLPSPGCRLRLLLLSALLKSVYHIRVCSSYPPSSTV